jgi:hypothetical protein
VTSETGGSARLQGREQSLLIPGKKCSTLVCTAFVYTMAEEHAFSTDNLKTKLLK